MSDLGHSIHSPSLLLVFSLSIVTVVVSHHEPQVSTAVDHLNPILYPSFDWNNNPLTFVLK